MNGVSVTTRGLVHIYSVEGQDVAALSGVDLTIAAGETVCLLGPSGSGKSTLLSLLGGLMRPSAGSIRIGTHLLGGMSESELSDMRAGNVGVVLQDGATNILPHLHARDNVAFAQSLGPRTEDLPDPLDVLDLVGAAGLATTMPRHMSPGEAQLVAIAVAVASAPGLLLADEPTARMTHAARDHVLSAVRRINETSGTTVVTVSHDDAVARAMRRTITIRDGRVGAEGRGDVEYAVVSADGSLPLPPDVLDRFPPGTELRVRPEGDGWILVPADEDGGT